MNTTLTYDGGLQTVSSLQVVYLDFDGANTAYHGEMLTIEGVTVQNSGLTDAEISTLTERLNTAYQGTISFVTERPLSGDYSTVYVGATDAFSYHGLAETIDIGNQSHNDNAFVNLQGNESLETIQQIIAHEVDHLTGTLDHGGGGLAAYAYQYNVSSGVTSTNVTLLNNDSMYVSSGGIANNTTVNGWMSINSGGVANNITVNSGGGIGIASGGTAINVIWTPCVGYIYVEDGAYVTYQSNYSGCYYGSNNQLQSKAMTMTGQNISSFCSMYIFSGGVANSTTINYEGRMYIFSSGKANSITINSSGSMSISSGGIASNTTVNSGGYMYISSGGVASGTTVNSGGYMFVSSGGSALNVIWTPCVGTVSVADGAYVTYQSSYSGCYYGSNNQLQSQTVTMSGKTIFSLCSMSIFSGGIANNTTINGGAMTIFSGGTANSTTMNAGGSIFISSGGVANNTSLSGWLCSMSILSRGVASRTTINNLGMISIFSGGIANSTTVNSGGYIYISSGGSAINVIWTPCVGTVSVADGAYVTYRSSYSGCYYGSNSQLQSQAMTMTSKMISGSYCSMYIFSGGIANSNTLNYGRMFISSGGTANSTTNNLGNMQIFSGGIANSNTVNSWGRIDIYSSGIANNTTMNAGGSMFIYSGGKVTGSLTITSGAVVSALAGANIDFDISKRMTGDNYLVNDLSLINGTPNYTITVSTVQRSGVYKLAQGASGINQNISIGNGLTSCGNLTVNGMMVIYRNYEYSLFESAGNLTLSIVNTDKILPTFTGIGADITTPTNRDVVITATFNDNIAVVISQYKIGNGEWTDYTGAITVTSNATVYFKAIDAADNEATTQYTVNNIDKVLPTITGIGANIITPTNQDVIISATFSDNIAVASKQYKIGNSSWTDYTTGVIVFSNGTVYFKTVDTAGNEATTQYEVKNIDKVAPTITGIKANPTVPTNQNVLVSAVFGDETALALSQYKIGNGEWINYTDAISVENNATIYFRAVDAAGNEATAQYEVKNIDKVAPTISDIKASSTAPTNQDVTISAIFADNTALAFSQYKIGDGEWTDYTVAITVTSNTVIHFRAVDIVGNETTKEYVVSNIDKISPVINDIDANITVLTNHDVAVTATFSDDIALASKEYRIGDGDWTNYTDAVSVSNNATVYFKAIDTAGNETTAQYEVKNILAVSPKGPGAVAPVVKVNKYDATVSWLAPVTQDKAKIVSYEVYVNGQLTSAKGTSLSLKAMPISVGNIIQIRALDSLGRYGALSQTITFDINDVTAPILGKVAAIVNDYSALVAWSGSDNVGIDHYQVKCGSQTQTQAGISATFDNLTIGINNVEIVAFDAAGNASKAVKIKITVKDVTAPDQVTGLAAPTVDSKYKATLSWSAGVDNSGSIASYEIQLDNGKIIKSTKTTLAVNSLAVGEHSYQVRAIDKAKNVGEWSAAKAFTVLDTTAPGTVSVKAVVAQNSILLSWKAPADNVGVTGYQVWVGASPSTMTMEQALSADRLSCILTNIPKGVYYMDVRAIDAANNVSATKPAKVTVSTALPVSSFAMSSPPVDLLTWNAPNQTSLALASGL